MSWTGALIRIQGPLPVACGYTLPRLNFGGLNLLCKEKLSEGNLCHGFCSLVFSPPVQPSCMAAFRAYTQR